ncbi:2727_t:CDS:2 [Acaulospora morrowiae]|uniref:2727_t:CDS:1 n=1 Tax=Acaulospora morrowiae TaxID=94023 RepID=A0A9N8VM11_9GLOM|nr:2727_t:CDS:2 [Acaulospora morrowiae]
MKIQTAIGMEQKVPFAVKGDAKVMFKQGEANGSPLSRSYLWIRDSKRNWHVEIMGFMGYPRKHDNFLIAKFEYRISEAERGLSKATVIALHNA